MIGQEPKSGFIQTFTGELFWPLDPQPAHIHIRDIAHALSLICRFTGHTRVHYSVAQHSVIVSECVPKDDALWGLLHDAAEAYIGDLNAPTKRQSEFQFFRHTEEKIMYAISQKFKLTWPEPAQVKMVDRIVCDYEQRALMPYVCNRSENGHLLNHLLKTVRPVEPEEAERKFLERYEELTGINILKCHSSKDLRKPLTATEIVRKKLEF